LVANIIGTGMTPESKAPDPAFRKEVHQLWLDWTDQSDADGVLDFYGQQAQAVRAWLEAGEVFIRLRPRLPVDNLMVPLQLQIIEAEHCPTFLTMRSSTSSVRAGIEIDAIGRRTFYHLYPSRPVEGFDLDLSELVRVPADSVIHLYDPLRPGQLRGAPLLTQALIRLYEIDAYDDATIVRQKVAALFAGFVTREPQASDAEINPLTGKAIETDRNDNQIVGLEPGLLQELPAGQTVNFSDPPLSSGYGDFMRTALMSAAIAADVPYEVLTGDMRGVNDRTVRVVLNEFRRRVEQSQHHIVAYQLNRRVWDAWFDRAVLSGALNPPADYFVDALPWKRVEWIAAAWPYLNPLQDIDAHTKAIRAGVATLTEKIKEISGRSLEDVLAERKEELVLLDKYEIVTDSDPRKTTDNGRPSPPNDPTPNNPTAPATPGTSTTGPGNIVEELLRRAMDREPPPITVHTYGRGREEDAMRLDGVVAAGQGTVIPPPAQVSVRKRVLARDAKGRVDAVEEVHSDGTVIERKVGRRDAQGRVDELLETHRQES
jgi:lambda family phage portal protein